MKEAKESKTFDDGKIAVEETLAAHPLLSDYGYGWAPRERRDIEPHLEKWRKDLLHPTSVKKILRLASWMERNLEKRRTINKMASSYGWKHMFEGAFGYISNGQFITAALLAGFKIDSSRPNPCLNISSDSFNR